MTRSITALALLATLTVGCTMETTLDPNVDRLSAPIANGAPVVDRFDGSPGCYVACYGERPGAYSVGQFDVHGLIRLEGTYPVSYATDHPADRICTPAGYEGLDISASSHLSNLCAATFPSCKGDCWAGGDTGGFFLNHPKNFEEEWEVERVVTYETY